MSSTEAVSQPGSRAAIYAVFFPVAAGFYWWTQHVLLLGAARWGRLIPGVLAAEVCVTGLALFSTYVFSGQIVSSAHDYGSRGERLTGHGDAGGAERDGEHVGGVGGQLGVVMILLSYLVAFGVCLHLGAVVGQAWNDRHADTTFRRTVTRGRAR
jgi:membrane protein